MAAYPSAIVADGATGTHQGANLCSSTIASPGISATDTVIPIVDATTLTTWPTANFTVLIGGVNLCFVVSRTGNSLNCSTLGNRSYGGTAAQAAPTGTAIVVVESAEFPRVLSQEVIAIETELGVNPSGSSATVAARLDAIEAGTSTTEAIQDTVGGMVSGNVEDGVSVTYDDPNGKLDFTNTDKGSTAVATHEASAGDIHPQYQKESEKGAASGYVGLNSNVKVPVAHLHEVVTLVDGATPALDASLGSIFNLVAAGDRTIAIPTNPTNGQKIVIQHTASGGARTLSLNTGAGGFAFGTDITALTATTSGLTDVIGCIYDVTANRWRVVAVAKGY